MSVTVLVWLLVAMCLVAVGVLLLLADRYERQMIEKPSRRATGRGHDREE